MRDRVARALEKMCRKRILVKQAEVVSINIVLGKLTGKKGRKEMVDYAELAGIARARHEAERHSAVRHRGPKADPKAYFDKVKTHVFAEMIKANVELRRSGAPLLGRNHLPGFDREIFVTFGTDLLCRVSLEVRSGTDFILAVISGPPNGLELSRREYPCNYDASSLEMPHAVDAGAPVIGIRPELIAVDIISSVLRGEFA